MTVETLRYFLTLDECRELIRLTNECTKGGFSPCRYTLQCKYLDPVFMHPIRDRLINFIEFNYGADLFPDLTITMRMEVGDAHGLHADAVQLNGEPNHTPYRVCVGMVYLNTCGSDYRGGEIRFPELDQIVCPTWGLLVAFPSDLKHQHEVPTITEGKRYSMSMWFTRDERRREQWT